MSYQTENRNERTKITKKEEGGGGEGEVEILELESTIPEMKNFTRGAQQEL